MNKFTKKEIKRIEKETCFGVQEYEDYYYFNYYSPAGEDFGFEITREEKSKMIENIIDYAFDFDPEEHAAMWYGANRGEPSSMRALLDDADDIAEQLDKLSDLVKEFR